MPEVKAALDAFCEGRPDRHGHGRRAGGSQVAAAPWPRRASAWFHAANVGTAAYAFLTMANANLLRARLAGADRDASCSRCWRAASSAPCACPSRRPGRRSPTSPPAPSRSGDGTLPAVRRRRCGSPAATTNWRENIVHLVLAKIPGGPGRASRASRCSSCRSSWSTPTARGRAQRRRARRPQPQDGLPRHRQHAAELRRGQVSARTARPGAVGYLVGEPHRGPELHVPHDERGAHRRRAGRDRARLHRLPEVARLRPRAPAGPAGRGARIRPRRRCRSSSTPTSGECCWRRRPMSRARWRWCCTAARWSTTSARAETEDERARATLLLDILTPIAKSWPSQWCLEANSLAIQVHGGYGYTRDYDVEQHYRDNRLNPIHEGTHGIQGLDLLGRKVVQHNGAGLLLLWRRHRRHDRRRRVRPAVSAELAARYGRDRQRLVEVTAGLFGPASRARRWPTARSTWRRSGNRRGLDLAGAAARRPRQGGRLLRRQTRRRPLLLPAASCPKSARSWTFSPRLDRTVLDTATGMALTDIRPLCTGDWIAALG